VAGLSAVPGEDVETVKLLVTELVTNSVRHAGPHTDKPIVLTVRRVGTVLRVAVTDEGPGFEHEPGQPLPLVPGGRGLLLVERLSDCWGVTRGRATCVWFELDIGDADF
jgi:anti-sigma regulatory factor (Ser/Thr protein kinase)